VPARLSAERRVGRRLTHASSSSHFDNAHNDPATLAAEIGVPALGLAVAAFAGLVVAVRRRRERPVEPKELPEDLLIAMLVGLAVLGLASFPLRMPALVPVLSLGLGFAWERVRNGPAPPGGGNVRLQRSLYLALCAALAVAASARILAVRFQADGERLLREANVSEGVDRLDRLENAKGLLERSVALRPGHPQAWLALGNTRRLTGDLDGARAALARSLALEERAETDLNMGLLTLARGEAGAARQWFVRALWLAPNLKAALPAEADPDAVASEVAEAERRMAAGAEPPAVPSKG
jgi:tetratricopeptide (TPR) repeat protein